MVNLILIGELISDEQLILADINQDGALNIIDVVLLVNDILNL